MEQKSMTIPEVMKATMDQLNAIAVPVGMMAWNRYALSYC